MLNQAADLWVIVLMGTRLIGQIQRKRANKFSEK